VERECASVWWYNRIRRPRVDVESFASPTATAMRNIYGLIGRSVEVLDITADRAIPTFVAVSRSEEPLRNDYALGFGAHFDPQVALTRSLTEMTQLLPSLLSGRNPRCFLSAEDAQSDMSFLTPEEQLPPTLCSDFSPPVARQPKQQVLSCVELVKSWGLEMITLEQTRENIGMPVVKVVVPGMRSWWARFAPGRLYTLPVQLGWLASAKVESEMNSAHLIL
jgi:oxazoline/thiazoline synthase